MILHLIRAAFYFWIGVEFAFTAYAYWFGNRIKRSKIITSLQDLLITLSVYFFYLAFLPVIKIVNPQQYAMLVKTVPLLLIPLLVAIHQFRSSSMNL